MTEVEPDARRAEIAANLTALEERIAAACLESGRSRDEVGVIAVTKTFPASDVVHLQALGMRDVGENRADEVADKEERCRAAGVTELSWHFVGQLQTNKAGAVAQHCDVVHSVDRLRLVTALERASERAGRRLRALVQVDLSGDPGRGGAAPEEFSMLAEAVAAAEHLDLAGMMTVAPLGADPAEAFARLAALADELRTAYPQAVIVSAGMSANLEAAIAHGATHLRVGTALLGSRPPLG